MNNEKNWQVMVILAHTKKIKQFNEHDNAIVWADNEIRRLTKELKNEVDRKN